MFVAISDAHLEFRDDVNAGIYLFKSAPSGAVYGELPYGNYQVIISHPDFGSKITSLDYSPDGKPAQFRLMSKKLTGYMWPKWSQSGESAEMRFSSHEVIDVTLWKLGWEVEKIRELGRFEPFAPSGDCQTLPDGDVSQSGVRWNHERFQYPPDLDARTVVAP